MSYGWAINLDRYTKLKFLYTLLYTLMILILFILMLPEIEEAILLSLGLNLD